jgi:hypothetical protein
VVLVLDYNPQNSIVMMQNSIVQIVTALTTASGILTTFTMWCSEKNESLPYKSWNFASRYFR